MKLYKSICYENFHCIASACPDTCCQEWDIQVDPDTASLYESLPGELGEKIRSSLHQEDGETVITLKDNHCPMQSPEGLCTIQAALGEQALCQVCRDFPRLHHDYGDFMELNLELSCPEAARLLLTTPAAPPVVEEVPGGSEPDYDEEAMSLLLSSRKWALDLLTRSSRSDGETLVLLFFYGCSVQEKLDGEESPDFNPEDALDTAKIMAASGSFGEITDFFLGLEILTPEWEGLLKNAHFSSLSPYTLSLARYLVSRYWLQAVSDYDLYCRVKFILISCILVSSLPGDGIWNAHLFSKEIENDADNVDAILDAAYSGKMFTDARLLGFLLGSSENRKV